MHVCIESACYLILNHSILYYILHLNATPNGLIAYRPRYAIGIFLFVAILVC